MLPQFPSTCQQTSERRRPRGMRSSISFSRSVAACSQEVTNRAYHTKRDSGSDLLIATPQGLVSIISTFMKSKAASEQSMFQTLGLLAGQFRNHSQRSRVRKPWKLPWVSSTAMKRGRGSENRNKISDDHCEAHLKLSDGFEQSRVTIGFGLDLVF